MIFAGILDGIWDVLSAPFRAAAGWAWDSVIGGVTDWLAKGFVQLLTLVWQVMDATTTPHLNAEWFSGTSSGPYVIAIGVAGMLLSLFLLIGLCQGALAGQPRALVTRLVRETPEAVLGILFTAALTQVAIEATDAISSGIWLAVRGRAVNALDGLGRVATLLPAGSFLTPLLLLVGMVALLLLWVVLVIRESLIYLVVALAPLAWATSVWPALRGTIRKLLELLGALVFSKIAIALALAVGIGALGGVGATAPPGTPVASAGAAEFSTVLVGIVTFAMAAFMPYLVLRLLPLVEGAAVAQGVAGAPMRTVQTGMQYGYYAQATQQRLASSRTSTGDEIDTEVAAEPARAWPSSSTSPVNTSAAGSTDAACASGAGGAAGAAGAVAVPLLVGEQAAGAVRDHATGAVDTGREAGS